MIKIEDNEALDNRIAECLKLYDGARHDLNIFMNGVAEFIAQHPDVTQPGHEIVHSHKRRLKDKEHLAEKIRRKAKKGIQVDSNNFFDEITDLSGVRILHLFQEEFGDIHRVILKRLNDGDWVLGETPRAYTWDPESIDFFKSFNLEVIEKSTSYTSVHYLVRPRKGSKYSCEIQVRTLFEEIWGEVDHRFNYPNPSDDIACREQIRVLSKIVGAGSRLLDALSRVQSARK